ncbi:MAG: dienelactone hydrolase family protein [Gammaproteobacteria bacterium]|nr:dienelactone hydrolase family protein [Gammaproteobacteria bacterium]
MKIDRLSQSLLFLGFCFIASPSGAEVTMSATAEDALPAAIVGEAPELAGEAIGYFAGDVKASGYLAIPSGEGPHGAVILIHEWNGLVERVKETADAFAAEGYVALAADLYSGRTGANPAENMALVRETLANPETIIANLNAAAGYLRERADTSGKIAAIGWCYGGGVALSFALGGEHHDATAIFYGRLLDDPEKMRRIDHEVYGTFARHDQGIPVESVNDFVATLRSAGIENDVHIYDEISHGFWLHVDRNPEINTGPALDAWRRLKAYLGRTLGG